MMAGANCDCLVCRIEKSLVAELGDEGVRAESRQLAASSRILSCFPAPLDLVRELHVREDGRDRSSADALLRELIEQHARGPLRSICQRLLLLVFIPTIHRTASHVAASFPSVAHDDAAQHVVSVFLEFLGSLELQTRQSHVAFTVARKLRRLSFRWAIRESRGAPAGELDGDPPFVEQAAVEEPYYPELVLNRFLDGCERMGWLSAEERDLLVRFKLEGASSEEIAGRNGHAAAAVRHRIQRLLDRLRRLAQQTRWQRTPEQLELFSR
jgi:DNA-directed RNA polymerase specialized sigma24 family protein